VDPKNPKPSLTDFNKPPTPNWYPLNVTPGIFNLDVPLTATPTIGKAA